MKEDQSDQGHAERIDEHQHRNGRNDDGLQTEQADEVGNHRETDDPLHIGEFARQLHKECCAAGEQANRRGDAGKQHNRGKQVGAKAAEEDLSAFCKHRRPRILHADSGNAFRADLGNEDINQCKKQTCEHAGLHNLRGNSLRIRKADFLHRIHNQSREHKCCNGVKRVVAVKHTLECSLDRFIIGFARRLEVSHRRCKGHDDHDGQRDEQRRREELADSINKL